MSAHISRDVDFETSALLAPKYRKKSSASNKTDRTLILIFCLSWKKFDKLFYVNMYDV